MIRTVANRPLDAPMVSLLDLKAIGLCRNTTVEFYDAEGNRHAGITSAKFMEQPSNLIYQSPYILATIVKQNLVEIRTLQPSMLV